MSAVLLDTHALLWWLDDDPRLGTRARRTIARGDITVSIVTFWEIALKHGIGKLAIAPEPVAHAVDRSGFAMLDLARHHCFALARLPLHHRDPFDRMLIAQAQSEEMPILTSDRRFAAYEVTLLAEGE
ncbi:MAG: type II toxin-antitoxin system VapC family toxin [Geminicoccaceae bacterium]